MFRRPTVSLDALDTLDTLDTLDEDEATPVAVRSAEVWESIFSRSRGAVMVFAIMPARPPETSFLVVLPVPFSLPF